MMEKMRVAIYSQPWDGAVHIAFMMVRNGQTLIAKPVEFSFVPIKDFEHTESTLKIHSGTATEFLSALADALDAHGVKTDSDAKIAGTLDATRYHLEDLRDLLKLKKPEERQ